ncbi:hypothetical protein [Polluticaenibacter yanchengensis]|uniref:Uncharacterized protein n=1 Tax=Polluticaenibacter yanchengensis TaxID=3014562 RepID=A0ABT4UIT6_9BACT|nr:hypothetical protein [Chitinophagaceae bacterium LY-5]
MSNKLTINHLAKRMPYGLIGLSKYDTMYKLNTYSNMSGRGIENRTIASFLDEQIKPILFPLSALTQEITVNGETFVPIVKILKRTSLIDLSKCEFEIYIEDNEIYVNAHLNRRIIIDSMYYDYNLFFHMENSRNYKATNPQSEPQNILLELHIDTDDLIGQGLAISVFDLPKNPYKGGQK